MEEKALLINSMEKLINHIVVSKKNQQEIFASLSKNDFKKIISNLDDENFRLRKISLSLISQILYNNTPLKEKFCQIMTIPTVPGRVALNSKFAPSSVKSKNTLSSDIPKNAKEVFQLLKQPLSESEKQSLFWFINYNTRSNLPLQLEYLTHVNAQSLAPHEILDPLDCMIGFILPDKSVPKRIETLPISSLPGEPGRRNKSEYQASSPVQTQKIVNNFFKPNMYNHNRPSVNLNQSVNQGTGVTHGVNQVNQSFNQGYGTDREMGKGVGNQNIQFKAGNSHIYTDQGSQLSKTAVEILPPPLHQLKNSMDIQNFNRVKYGGIKLISSTTSTKNKQPPKYFEQNPVFVSQTTTHQTSKMTHYPNGNIPTSKSINLGGQRIERGYETLREKKIVEKFPI